MLYYDILCYTMLYYANTTFNIDIPNIIHMWKTHHPWTQRPPSASPPGHQSVELVGKEPGWAESLAVGEGSLWLAGHGYKYHI